MKRMHSDQRGFSLAELLIVIAIIAVLSTVVLLNMKGGEVTAKESALRSNLKIFREALQAYHADHGFFPCDPSDYNSSGNLATLKNQLLWYTNVSGQPSQTKTSEFRYGPYLQKFPDNPFYNGTDKTKLSEVVIERTRERVMEALQTDVANGTGNNGWYYEARTGLAVPNLGGSDFSDDYVKY